MWGYVERYCDYADDNASNRSVWSHDIIIDIPTGNIATGCAALCGQDEYDGLSRVSSLASAEAACTSASTWSDFSAAGVAQTTLEFDENSDPSTVWGQVHDYTSDGAAASNTMVQESVLTTVVTTTFTSIAPATPSSSASGPITLLPLAPAKSVVVSVYTTTITSRIPVASSTPSGAVSGRLQAASAPGLVLMVLSYLAARF